MKSDQSDQPKGRPGTESHTIEEVLRPSDNNPRLRPDPSPRRKATERADKD